MKFEPAPIKDTWIISLAPIGDDRGYFARAYCRKEFEEHGINPDIAQCNTSYGRNAGTLRGLHYQTDPVSESKMMRCVRGSLYDVIVDMRPDSSTYLQYFGIELSAENQKMLYVPRNCAHGFLTLEPNTQAFYMVGEFYTPQYEKGIRYDDPVLGIEWPIEITEISDKDKSWPLLQGEIK